MRPSRELALACAPKCRECTDGVICSFASRIPCDLCDGTGRLGVNAIAAAIEADRAGMQVIYDEHKRALGDVMNQRDNLAAELAKLRAELDEAVGLLRRCDLSLPTSWSLYRRLTDWLADHDARKGDGK